MVHMLETYKCFLDKTLLTHMPTNFKASQLYFGVSACLLVATVTHVITAISLVRENRAARPTSNGHEKFVQASGSRTMGLSGSILFAFIVFHVLHYTVRNSSNIIRSAYVLAESQKHVHDVYTMIIMGFEVKWFCFIHHFHGAATSLTGLVVFSKLLASVILLGPSFDALATSYGWIVFVGFVSVPISVLAGVVK